MPFDGEVLPQEAADVAQRWSPTDPRWKAAADDLALELHRFRRGSLTAAEPKRIRLVLGRATELGIIETEAVALGRRLALLALQIVKARLDEPEPDYPKSRTKTAREGYLQRVRDWEVGMAALLASCGDRGRDTMAAGGRPMSISSCSTSRLQPATGFRLNRLDQPAAHFRLNDTTRATTNRKLRADQPEAQRRTNRKPASRDPLR